MSPCGTHILMDLFDAPDPGGARGEELLRKVSEIAGCKVCEVAKHTYPGGSQSIVLLLSTSHASLHPWPEEKYVAFDLYSCTAIDNPTVDKILDLVLEYIPARRHTIEVLNRGRDLSA